MRLSIALLAFAALLPAQTPPAPAPAPPNPATPAPSTSVDPNTVVLTIGDRHLTALQYEALIKTLLPVDQQASALGAGRRNFAQRIVAMFVLADEAVRQNLDKRPDVAVQLLFQRENLLETAMFKTMIQTAVVPDADVQAYYDSHQADFVTVTARHILIRVKGSPMPAIAGRPELSDDEARAKADSIRKRLAAGEDFATLAKQESDDSATAIKGGDLGEFRHGQMVPPFEQAAFALKPGDISEPVRSTYGYHIVQVQSHSVKSLADAKTDILAQLKPAVARKEGDAMLKQTIYTIDDGFFGPPPAPIAAGPAPPAPAPAR
jgi:peptidyl-prolyl cis-trans isomerase C